MSGYFWGSAGSGIDLTYSFMDSNSLFSTDYNLSGKTAIRDGVQDTSSALKSTVSEILDLYNSVSLLNFTEVSETANVVGNLRIGTTTVETSAFAWLPYMGWDLAGDIWFNDTQDLYNNVNAIMDGNYWNQTITHEIGHALGLSHTQDASSYGSRTYGSHSSYGGVNNANPYSTMAYPEYVGEPLDGAENMYSRPTTLMIDDIIAIQHLYGVNENYNSTDTVYTLASFNNGLYTSGFGIDYIYASIWDAGGNDTFSWSDQSTVASINLNAGNFSSFGNITGPDDTDLDNTNLQDGDGILGIGYNVLIENAIGGINIDTILGNEADNKLYGGSGSGVKDTLTGGSGADTFICSINDATTNLNLADIITDFTNGTDKIGLEDIAVSNLSWSDVSGGTKIIETSTSKVLFYLNSVSSSVIDENDFVQTDFV